MLKYISELPASFGPDTIRIMSDALDDAWRAVQANKAKFNVNAHGTAARDLLANHIVAMAKKGELDRQRLVDGALARLRL
jgi:hypothetical protein